MENPLRVAICEDVTADTKHLQDCILHSGMSVTCQLFENGESFLVSFTADTYDIIFMDIYMGDMKGTTVVEEVRKVDERVTIAFTTTSQDHTLESYRLGALKYLEKPVTPEAVKDALELADMKRKKREHIILLVGGKYENIPLDTILYFEVKDHVIQIITTSGLLVASQTVRMSEVEARITSPYFVRCHHSYIVNLAYVKSIDTKLKMLLLTNGDNTYISRQNFKRTVETYEDYLFSTTRGEQQ